MVSYGVGVSPERRVDWVMEGLLVCGSVLIILMGANVVLG